MKFRRARRARRLQRAFSGLFSTFALTACARSGANPPAQPAPVETRASLPLPELELADLLPPFQPEFLLHVFPRAILETSSLAPLKEAWLGGARRAAFSAVTGVELSRLTEVWIASYGLGTLYLTPRAGAEGAHDAFLSHSQSPIARSTQHTSLRVWDAQRDGAPSALVIGPYFTAFAFGDPSLKKFVLERARGKLVRIRSSTEARALTVRERPGALASFFFAGPLSWESEPRPTSAFMDTLLSIEADIRAEGSELTLEMSLIGAWGEASEAEERATLWQETLLARPEMRALGLGEHARSKVTCDDRAELNQCQLLVNLDPKLLCEAWQRLMLQDLSSY